MVRKVVICFAGVESVRSFHLNRNLSCLYSSLFVIFLFMAIFDHVNVSDYNECRKEIMM